MMYSQMRLIRERKKKKKKSDKIYLSGAMNQKSAKKQYPRKDIVNICTPCLGQNNSVIMAKSVATMPEKKSTVTILTVIKKKKILLKMVNQVTDYLMNLF